MWRSVSTFFQARTNTREMCSMMTEITKKGHICCYKMKGKTAVVTPLSGHKEKGSVHQRGRRWWPERDNASIKTEKCSVGCDGWQGRARGVRSLAASVFLCSRMLDQKLR